MNKAIKAALLSAFIFPGAGHLLLKRYISAAILATTTLAATYLLILEVLKSAMQIVDRIQRGEVDAGITTISELASQPIASNSLLSGELISWILLVTWLVAIIDSYRVGRLQQKK